MIRGIDVSHWQGVIDWKKVASIVDEKGERVYQFAFIKCSQGTTMRDPKFATNKAGIRAQGMAFGAYHFAGNMPMINGKLAIVPADPVAEADHFLASVGDLLPGDIVILDYETNHLKDPATWCLAWLNRVEEKLGWKPMLYTYHALIVKYNWKKVSDNNNGLWVARYSSIFKPSSGSWPFYAIHQYTSDGSVPGIVGRVDLNKTEMDLPALLRYGKPGSVVPPECTKGCPVHCQK